MGTTPRENAQIRFAKIWCNTGELFLYPLVYKKHGDISAQKNLCYSRGGRCTNLDIFSKEKTGENKTGEKKPGEKKPLLLYIHGGGWASGLKFIRQFYCCNWAEQGYTAVNIGYNYGVGVGHPEHLKELFKAFEYVLDRADELGIDPGRIVVAGESSGAHLAAMAGAITSHPGLYEKFGINFAYKETFRPSALVLISGIYDMERSPDTHFPMIKTYLRAYTGMSQPELDAAFACGFNREISPEPYVDSAFPASFVIGSSMDKLLPESRAFYEKLQACGVPAGWYLCKGLHGVHAGGLACDRFRIGKESVRLAQEFCRGQKKDIP